MIAYAASVMHQSNDCAFDRIWRGRADRRAFLIGGLALLGASQLARAGAAALDDLAVHARRRVRRSRVGRRRPLDPPGAAIPLSGGGMPPEPSRSRWEVADDDAMRRS